MVWGFFTGSYVVTSVFHPVSSIRHCCECTSTELFASYISIYLVLVFSLMLVEVAGT